MIDRQLCSCVKNGSSGTVNGSRLLWSTLLIEFRYANELFLEEDS